MAPTVDSTTEGVRYRKLPGTLGIVQRVLAISLPVIAVAYILRLPEHLFHQAVLVQQYVALFLAIVLLLTYLSVPLGCDRNKRGVPWYDVLLGVSGAIASLYLAVTYPKLLFVLGIPTVFRAVLGVIVLVTVLEGVRRMTGWTLVIVVAVFILYARYTHIFPGFLAGQDVQWLRLLNYIYAGADSLFGFALAIGATTVFSFILFGQFLTATGGGNFFFEVANALMGRYRGGPAKVAVVASGLFGTISGSAVANVVSTGVVTIPLMKRLGYSPVFAGAVEAAASTGGSIMPPVMGASAFLMAEFLGIPYGQVALAALIPAVMYYLGIFVQVDLRAAKTGLKGLDVSSLPSIKRALQEGWPFAIPILVLIYTLLIMYLPAEVSALYAIVALLVVLALRKETRTVFTKLLSILESAGWSVLEIILICGAVGFVIGLVSISGLAFSLPQFLLRISGDNLMLLLVITAVAAVILGMGLPVTASYVMLSVLMTPALVKMNVMPLAAHLFVIYFSVMSFVTPPVAVAAYAAASVAKAPMMPTAWQAVRLGISAYLVPFISVYHYPLLAQGNFGTVILSALWTALGVFAIAAAIEGYLWRQIGPVQRAVLVIGGLLMILPELYTTITGAILVGVVLVTERLLVSRSGPAWRPGTGSGPAR